MPRVIVALVLLAAATAARADSPAGWMGVSGASAERLAEPVFGGEVMLYRAGPRGAEPVVLVHGLGENGARDWAHVVPALARTHEVFALDLPGFGLSDKGNELYTPDNYARVLEATAARRVGRPFTLVGHSMGAAVSLAYADAYPARVRRLVLVDMAGVLHGAVYAESLVRFGIGQTTRIDPRAPWLDSMMRGVIARIEAMPVDRDLLMRMPAVRQRLLGGDPNMIAAYLLADHDFSAALRRVRAPTVLVWGADDEIAPLRTGQLAAATLPDARLEVIPGAGHSPQVETPSRFNALLLDALQERPRPAPPAPAPWQPTRVESCTDRAGARFAGDYLKLTLINCRGAQITDARIGELRVLESEVSLLDSEVRDGLYALRSRVRLTGGSVAGAPPLQLQDSGVDAAGTRFEARGPVAENLGETPLTLQLSVTEVRQAGKAPRYVHDVVSLAPKTRW